MPKIIQATLDCYSGSCQNCHPPTSNCLSWRQVKQLVEKVTLYAGDIRMITTKMPKIIQATLDCYSGSCQNCHPPTWNCLSWRQAKQLVEKVTAFEGMWPDTTQYLTRFNKICHPSQRPRWQVDKEAIGLSRVQQCSSTYSPPS